MSSSMLTRCHVLNRHVMSASGIATRRFAPQLQARSHAHWQVSQNLVNHQSSKVWLAAGVFGATILGTATADGGASSCESPSNDGFETISLKDGRKLAYKVHGTGVPIFAFHGMESSRETFDTNIWGSPPQSVESLFPGVQIIAVDRPGYGDSSDPPCGYTYLSFVDDLVELADKLKLRKFCVAGHSSGGPYALAASAKLPDRVVACAAISSDAPYVHPKASPEFVKSGAEMGGDPLIRSGYFGGKKSDRHPWKQGCLGWVCDYTLERIEYPFSLETISQGERLTIWVGTEDVPCISLGAKFLHQLIPGALVREQPRGHGLKKDLHGKVEYRFLEEIFSELKARFIISS